MTEENLEATFALIAQFVRDQGIETQFDAVRAMQRSHPVPPNVVHLANLPKAKQWMRAAIVYAYTEPRAGQGARTDKGRQRSALSPDAKMSFRAFAAMGFPGLTHHDSVARYWGAWQHLVDEGAVEPAVPGDTFTT